MHLTHLRSRALAAPVLLLSASLCAQDAPTAAGSVFYAVTKNPATFTVVDGSTPRILATVPLDGVPFDAVLGAGNTKAYILHGPADKGASLTVSVVELATRTVSATIPVGPNVRRLYWSHDERLLLCVATGAGDAPPSATPTLVSGQLIVVIDPMKNQVMTSLTSSRFSYRTLFTPDASRFFFINMADGGDRKTGTPGHAPSVTTFSLEQRDPLADVELPDVSAAVLSPDGKWLYVLDPGNVVRHRDAAVAVIDVGTGKLAARYAIGSQPRGFTADVARGVVSVLGQRTGEHTTTTLYLFTGKDAPATIDAGDEASGLRPMGSDGVRVILARDSLRFLDRDGRRLPAAVFLNPARGADAALGMTQVGGSPGEAVPLVGRDRLVMSVVQSNGEPTGTLAIIDLKQHAVLKVIQTGRASARFLQNATAAMAVIGAAMDAAASVRMAADPQLRALHYGRNNNVTLYSPPPPNLRLAAGPEGKFVYAFNSQTDDIAVVASDDGAIVKTIAFGNCSYLLPLPRGKFMLARNPGNILLIDTDTHEAVEHKVSGGFHGLYVFRDRPLLAALTGKGLLLWDTGTGVRLAALSMPEPVLLLDASPDA